MGSNSGQSNLRRFTEHKPSGNPNTLAHDHPAAVNATTRYPQTVIFSGFANRILKSGHNSRKIGAYVVKGKWSGMPIFTLTLEERATCPDTCRHWLDCYGNKMHWSERLMPGPELEWRIAHQLEELQDAHPEGFVVRLHVLGDFYSLAYACRWIEWLETFPALHVFGYTSWSPDTEIGKFLDEKSRCRWDRFAMRFSNAGLRERGTLTIYEAPKGPTVLDGIVCPAQTGRTDCCGTCGLCWQTRRNIVFLAH